MFSVSEYKKAVRNLFTSKMFILLAIILLIGGSAVLLIHQKNTKKPISGQNLTSLVNNGDCNKGIQITTRDLNLKTSLDHQIAVQSYRADCFRQLGRYDEALKAYDNLRTDYLKQGDDNDISIADDAIATVKATMKHSAETTYQRTGVSTATKVKD